MTLPKMRSPTAYAFIFMTLVAVLYEPLRLSLSHQISENIGGVGGVGGLVNLLGAGDERCDHSTNAHNSTYHDNYCYEKGSLGPFTPFSFFMLVVWVGPILVAAIFSIRNFKDCDRMNSTTVVGATDTSSSSDVFALLAVVWIGLNCIWFLIPLSVFWFGLMTDVEGSLFSLRILAVAIAAAHPLSWNLMVAAIPASGIVSKLLGCDRQTMFDCHRFVSYFTVGWGLLHGVLEIVYMTMARSPKTGDRKIVDALLMRGDGENLIYTMGFVALFLVFAQGIVGYGRKVLRERNWSFRKIHRALAFALLLVAAAHWWPFFLFLIPAISFHGVGIACFRCDLNKNDPNKSLSSLPHSLTRAEVAFLVILSVVSSCLSTLAVWTLREKFMTSSAANLSVPFVFPVFCILASLLSSVVSTTLCLVTFKGRTEERPQEENSNPFEECASLLEPGLEKPLLQGLISN